MLDGSLRLAIPTRFRSQWQPARDGQGWMCMPWPSGCLRLYTEGVFTRLAEQYGTSLTPTEAEADVHSMLFGMAQPLTHDTAGRIQLPKHHLHLAKMKAGPKDEVVLVGAGNRLEVWDKERWQQVELERFHKLPELVRQFSNPAPTSPPPHSR